MLALGEPCYYGYERYIVLSSKSYRKVKPALALDFERPLKTDWKFEQDRERTRPVHRYDRVKRFEWILYQILGYRGSMPEDVIELCEKCDLRGSHIWASIQAILKSNGLRRYYNRIGQIIWRVTRLKIYFKEKDRVLERIIEEFRGMQFVHQTRKYFPNLRYVALRMLKDHGAVFEYDVPLLKTKRKLKGMDELYLSLKNEA